MHPAAVPRNAPVPYAGGGTGLPDPRVYPLIELDRGQLQAMLRPLLGGAGVRGVARVEGGLVNTTYRVAAGADHPVYAVRVYASGQAACHSERRLLAALAGRLPVPEVLLADPGGPTCAHPFVVYRWIDGITLNELRRRAGAGELLALAEPLGRLAARIAGIQADGDALLGREIGRLPTVRVSAALECADEQLRADLARDRLGATLADGLRERLAAAEPLLLVHEQKPGLLHGDFGGRNVLVRAGTTGEWEISGLLDWETAGQGTALWDVGSLFRYARRYSPEFRERFLSGYRAAGGALADGWWPAARLLDATRLVDTLSEARELPAVFAECRDLVAAMLGGEGSAA
jgi:aminoglycoside phosphotransferase (APT) family kinase protein